MEKKIFQKILININRVYKRARFNLKYRSQISGETYKPLEAR